MLGDYELHHPPKAKLNREAWTLLKEACPGLEIHHALGKQYESLCCLVPMRPEDHNNGFNHRKYIHGIPKIEAVLNVARWLKLLGDNYFYFDSQGLIGI